MTRFVFSTVVAALVLLVGINIARTVQRDSNSIPCKLVARWASVQHALETSSISRDEASRQIQAIRDEVQQTEHSLEALRQQVQSTPARAGFDPGLRLAVVDVDRALLRCFMAQLDTHSHPGSETSP